jgi:hypothetical protein
MGFRSIQFCLLLCICIALPAVAIAQAPAQSSSAQSSSSPSSSAASSSAKHAKQAVQAAPGLDPGAIADGVYRNKMLALSCKIPVGWVLRTDEMNARAEEKENSDPASAAGTSASNTGGKVLLAAFSRPPEAKAEDVNTSILIAAESVDAYPGLKDAAQYFGPLTEVANAQGFVVDEEPYEYAVGTKKVVRGDFQKDVGTRRMLQSSLAMLAQGYVVSITVIGGTDDEVEELIDGLSFTATKK